VSASVLPLEQLLEGADHVRRAGDLGAADLAAYADVGSWSPELVRSVLDVVAAPLLRASVEGRLGELADTIEVWATGELTVLAAPLDDGRHEVVVGHTSHLPLQLAAALGLGPRPRAHGVGGPLRLPASALHAVLDGGAPELPAGLPSAWRAVLQAWRSPVRLLRLSTGWFDPDAGERWRTVEVVDDLDRGPFLVRPAGGSDADQVVLAPTDPTTLLRLVSRLLAVAPD
jgi:hypothetical protein